MKSELRGFEIPRWARMTSDEQDRCNQTNAAQRKWLGRDIISSSSVVHQFQKGGVWDGTGDLIVFSVTPSSVRYCRSLFGPVTTVCPADERADQRYTGQKTSTIRVPAYKWIHD
jgi:hypothetical protein